MLCLLNFLITCRTCPNEDNLVAVCSRKKEVTATVCPKKAKLTERLEPVNKRYSCPSLKTMDKIPPRPSLPKMSVVAPKNLNVETPPASTSLSVKFSRASFTS